MELQGLCLCSWDCSAYTSIRAQYLLKLKASLGGSYERFEAMSSHKAHKAMCIMFAGLFQ